jgi:hypothetical protein
MRNCDPKLELEAAVHDKQWDGDGWSVESRCVDGDTIHVGFAGNDAKWVTKQCQAVHNTIASGSRNRDSRPIEFA